MQSWELEVTGESSMTLAEYYEDLFTSHGFSKQQVQGVLQQVGTEDYQAVVAMLHSREEHLESASTTCRDASLP